MSECTHLSCWQQTYLGDLEAVAAGAREVKDLLAVVPCKVFDLDLVVCADEGRGE